jgi:VWFA-related protein
MHRGVAPVAIAVACLAAAGASRQDAPQRAPTFRTGVEVVVLDVSVLDGRRMPVRGLTARDFTILEDGRPQQISSFAAVDLPDTERREFSASWMREVAPDVQRNDDAFANRGVFVIVLDDSTPMPAGDVPSVKALARSVVERLGPDAIVAVVFTFNQAAGQEFTQDRARLFAAIDRFNGSSGGLGFAMSAGTLYRLTIAKLRDVAENLAGLPQRRKAVVFVSVGLPIDIGLSAPALVGDLESTNLGGGEVVQRLMRDLQLTIDAAQRANVNIYGLDPGGLRAPMGIHDPLTGTTRLDGNPGLLNREFLQTVSASTGGFAVTNTNDAGPGITQIIRENASYYLLGYQPSNLRTEGKHRRVEVRANRPGVTVRTRNGYFEPRARGGDTARRQSEPAAPLERAIAGPVPQEGMSLRATAAPFALSGSRTAGVAIVLGVRQPVAFSVKPRTDPLQILLRAYDDRGRNVAADRLIGQIAAPADYGREVRYEVLSRLDLQPGRYQVRIAVEVRQGKSASVYCDVDVPDFTKLPLSLSGVAITRRPGLTTGPTDKVASLVPVVPTAEREFAGDQGAAAFLRVYQGGKGLLAPVALAVTIRDGRDTIVFEKRETLDVTRFSRGRAADVRFELPIATLAPGPQLLTIEATDGKRTARRHVRLAIR